MRILIVSPEPWRKDNSFGNTYSNIFGKLEGVEIAHIFFLDGIPDYEPNVKRYYIIPEGEVMASALRFWKNTDGVGHEVSIADEIESSQVKTKTTTKPSFYQRLLAFGKSKHWGVMFLARELAWKLGKVNYDGVMDFVNDFKPDVFFLPYYNIYYSNRLGHYIKQHTDFPMVLEMAMDHYSLKRVSWSPYFWLDRFVKRAMIRRLVKESEMMFVISKKLKDEMEKDLHVPCRILYKTPDENRSYKPYVQKNGVIKYLFTGNIYANRWKSLAMLVGELRKQGGGKLDIYTSTHISNDMNKSLSIEGVSEIHAPVSQEEVIQLQNEADVLVHVEAFDRFNKSLVRCAISTKIMDYLSVGRCILAIGPSDIASMEYLTENDIALHSSSANQLNDILRRINADHSIVKNYAEKGRNYATKELNAHLLRKELYNDLQRVIINYKKAN